MEFVVSHYNYWIAIFLMMAGFYIIIAHGKPEPLLPIVNSQYPRHGKGTT